MFRILLMVLVGLTAAAQTQIDLATQAKHIDFTAAPSTRPIKTGTSLPSTCTVGDMFFKTDAAAGANLYGCAAANAWTVQSGTGSGSGAGQNIESNGVPVGTRSTTNFIAGTGLTNLLTDTGSQINVQIGLDTAVVETQQGEQEGGPLLCASYGGSSSSYRCSLNPTAAAYATGMVLHWEPDINGAGGPTTLDVDGLGAVPVTLADGATNPPAADILAGQLYPIWYDGSSFRLLSSSGAGSSTAVADPGTNGIPYRSGLGTSTIATATNLSGPFFCQDNGTSSTYACNLNPAIGAYTAGTVYWYKANTANSGAATLNLNSLGATPIKKNFSQDLAANDINAGQWVMVVFDGTNMQMLSLIGNSSSGAGPGMLTRSKELPMGGFSNTGAGWYPASIVSSDSGTWVGGDLVAMIFGNAGTPGSAWQFRWDSDWDNSKPVALLLTAADPTGTGGHFKFDLSMACVSPGTIMGNNPLTFGAVLSTGTVNLSYNASSELSLTGLDFATTGCAPNSLAVIRASRDNTITNNSSGNLAVFSATLVYSVK